MMRSDNFYLDNESTYPIFEVESSTTIQVPLIKAHSNHVNRILSSRSTGPRGLARQTMEGLDNPGIRPPKIFSVALHPDYDIIITGGPLGKHVLNESNYNELPNRLEDYTDSDVDQLLEDLLVSPQEIYELREFQKALRRSDPNYRLVLEN